MTEAQTKVDRLLAVAHRNFLDCAFRVQQMREAIGAQDGNVAASAAGALKESCASAEIALHAAAEIINIEVNRTNSGLAGLDITERPN
jgi:hypothetical protein